MVYSDIKSYGLLGIIPKKKRYGTKKDKRIVRDAVLNNKDFLQFAFGDNATEYELEKVVNFIIKCNWAFYEV